MDDKDLTAIPAYRATMERLEALKRVSPTGVDYWLAREIYPVLGYARWEGFIEGALRRAIEACGKAGAQVTSHFRQTTKMVSLEVTQSGPRRIGFSAVPLARSWR
jgi:DNA-damage-inducible protein D